MLIYSLPLHCLHSAACLPALTLPALPLRAALTGLLARSLPAHAHASYRAHAAPRAHAFAAHRANSTAAPRALTPAPRLPRHLPPTMPAPLCARLPLPALCITAPLPACCSPLPLSRAPHLFCLPRVLYHSRATPPWCDRHRRGCGDVPAESRLVSACRRGR